MRLILIGLLMATLSAGAQEAAEQPPVDRAKLRMDELTLQREQLSMEMFAVLKKLRTQRQEALAQDEELRDMNARIGQMQEALEKRLLEKVPALSTLAAERDDLQAEYDRIRKEQVTLREKQLEDLKQKDPSGKE